MTRPFGRLFFLAGLAFLLQGCGCGANYGVSEGEDGIVERRIRLEDGPLTYKTDSTEQLSDDREDEERRVDVSKNEEMWYVWDGASNIVEKNEPLTSGGVTTAHKLEAFGATVIAVATAIFCNYVTKLFIQYQSQH